MNLEPLRQAYLSRARAAAAATLAEARRDAARLVEDAHQQAEQLLESARQEGRDHADGETQHARAQAERRLSSARLEAQRVACETLRQQALRRAQSLRGQPEYERLLVALQAKARAQLGGPAAVEVDPPAVGGVIARAGRRRVDYSLPAMVARSLVGLGSEVASLWR